MDAHPLGFVGVRKLILGRQYDRPHGVALFASNWRSVQAIRNFRHPVVLVMPPLGTDEMGSFHITHIMYPSAYPTQLSALERKPVIIITLPRIAILCFISVALRMW
ncbi:hypothetical protein HZH66_005057 [Vespula vulgaris]|uniref:Uncharacterized protein n=3 Tax=Vespula TaxID=7451 RepID=A0A834KA77_VESVU|nr:hypothetical protein HZH66_005057 [Vespula vulgaris]